MPEAVKILKKGGIVSFPTETVYGLAALAENKEAVRKIYQLKKRPFSKRLPLQVGSKKELKKIIPELSSEAEKVIKKFCPGPLTLILKKGGKNLGVRIPENRISRAILRKINSPLVVTSANLSGGKEAKRIEDVSKVFSGKIDLVIDGGKKLSGVPSTIVDLTKRKIKILRTGEIKRKDILKALA